VLATVTALTLVRFERDGDAGNAGSVALTERFIQVMESEHRELGLGDPTLGKVVRKLVGMLARRTDLWRSAVAGADWREATLSSLHKGAPSDAAIDRNALMLRQWWSALEGASLADLQQGKIG
jgi:cytochrome b pre-mRNA-processing protein 3